MKQSLTVYADGIIIDGLNIIHLLPRGELAFKKLVAIYRNFLRSGFPENHVKIVLDPNGPYLLSLRKGWRPNSQNWMADEKDIETYEKWERTKRIDMKVLLVTRNTSADIAISKMISIKADAGEKWLVLSNDRFLASKEELRRNITRQINEGRIAVPKGKSQENWIADEVEEQAKLHDKLRRYLDNKTTPRRLSYEDGEIKYCSYTIGKDYLIKYRKSGPKGV